MSFIWKTSSIGFPNFFRGSKPSNDLADFYRTMADACRRGYSYKNAKKLFSISAHQVETKKAAFQEFGLLYVVPRSDVVSITPVGQQLLQYVHRPEEAERDRRNVLLLLAHSLGHYQFDNPLPIGSYKSKEWAISSDVRPYLAIFYLLAKLDGTLSISELLGAVFALQKMKDLPDLAATINDRRQSKVQFSRLDGLPANERTTENLKIYFMAHVGLDSEIIKDQQSSFYGFQEQCYELTGLGTEIVEAILDSQFPDWCSSRPVVPPARPWQNEIDYFSNVIGEICPSVVFEREAELATQTVERVAGRVLTLEEVDILRELPKRRFEEGRRRLVTHIRAERNQALVRAAKLAFRRQHGRLFCEVCGFDFKKRYGQRGRNYIEAHHKTMISMLQGPITFTIDDLAMVCSNCHRMLHKPPWVTVEELAGQIQDCCSASSAG